ncbi:hypothetical protein [Streptomyces sp. NPDC101249]|uniref:hypothetical protein n=1 Tax=Streptomyces sp. NPDC101249 TaxID=3366140 RepID=UPI0038111088
MRRCTSPVLCLAAAAPLLLAAPPAHAGPGAPAPCADGPRFPLTSRIEGGPGVYEAGGRSGTWSLKLTNTTNTSCGDVHPVVVLVDELRELRPDQTRLEFDDAGHRPHPVHLETTDEDELVGAFDDGVPGFTVGPKETVSVTVRLAFAADAEPNGVTVKAAVVQRRGDKGDWVGRSDDYAFRVERGPGSDPDSESRFGTGVVPGASHPPTGGRSTGPASPADPARPSSSGPVPAPPTGSAAASGSAPAVGPGSGLPPGEPSAAASRPGRLPLADELAATGLTGTRGILALAAVLLVSGGALLLARRRR